MDHSILIDCDNLKILKAAEGADDVTALEFWTELLCPQGNTHLSGVSSEDFKCFTEGQLIALYENTVMSVLQVSGYDRILKEVVRVANQFEIDTTPVVALRAKLGRDLAPPTVLPVKEQLPVFDKVSAKPVTGVPTRPKRGSVTGLVWDIADQIMGTNSNPLGSKELRNAIIDACVDKGISKSTAGVQYSKFKKAKEASNL